jgi:PAS domain S-box-containing protein
MCLHQKQRALCIRSLVPLVIVLSVSGFAADAPAAEPQRAVLALYGSRPDLPSNLIVDQIIRSTLEGELGPRLDFYAEFVDTSRWSEGETQVAVHDFLRRRYAQRKLSAIIAVARPAINFMRIYGDELFPGVPIVAYGDSGALRDWEPGRPIAGVLAEVDLSRTVELILRLQPGTREILVISGTSDSDRWRQSETRRQLDRLEKRVKLTYMDAGSMQDFVRTVARVPDGTVILFLSMSQDSAGNKLLNDEVLARITKEARVPVYNQTATHVGLGIVGGVVFDPEILGRETAQLTLRVLRGERLQDLPVQESKSTVPMVDWRQVRRWGLDEKRLPVGTVVRFREVSVWESYKWYIIGGIALIIAETLLIFALLWQRARAQRAETQLSMTFDRLRLAVEAGKSVGWDWDIRSGRDRWFGDLETIYGIPSDNYSGFVDDFGRKIHPDDREHVWQAVADARQNRKPYATEFRTVRTDGTVRWITARGKFYYAHNGDPERMLGMAVDITDRKQTEQKLSESQNRLAGIVGSAMDAIIAVDEERRIVLFNAAAEKMFGCTQDEAVGTVIDRFIPERFRPEHEAYMRRFGESGVTTRNMGTPAALWAVRRNGQEFPMEASITHLESDGRKLFTVIIRDITERRRAEEAIRESEERFRLVADTAPVMIWTAGTDRKYSYVNKTWLDFTGCPLEAELGDDWAGGLHPDDSSRSFQTYVEAFDRREPFEMQYRLRRHDGQYRWLSAIGVPRFNPDHSFAGYIGSAIDVTERKLAEESLADVGRKLIEAHEEERTWIARELHDDVNQRMALLAIELDRWNQQLPPSAVELHDHIHHASQRISDIAADIQALSHRLHSSKLEYLGLVAAAKSFCKELSEQQKVEIDFSHAAIPRVVPKEISLCLFRVLQETLQNAVKHSGVRHFKVELCGTEQEIQLTVSDLGVGFDLQDAIQRRGLGLISMRERMRLVSGVMSIKSQPGSGTTIHARVPLKTDGYRAMAG